MKEIHKEEEEEENSENVEGDNCVQFYENEVEDEELV